MNQKHNDMKKNVLCLVMILIGMVANAQETSVAGFYPLKGSGRIIYNFNPGWRFHLGDVSGAEAPDFDDSQWEVVDAPHTSQLEPAEASGCRNYQGISWYRKRFVIPSEMEGKDVSIHFEAIMGKQKVYVNGILVKEQKGGYLPITIYLTDNDWSELNLKPGDECVVAVQADNSDDSSYPPGKAQTQLDFSYHGGMYRDVWLIGKSPVAITDAIERNQVAGGGVFIHYGDVSEKKADMFIDVEVGRSSFPIGRSDVSAEVTATIKDSKGKVVKTMKQKVALHEDECKTARFSTTIKNPHLWSPEDPHLYNVELKVTTPSLTGKAGGGSDGGMVRAGIRKAEFRGKDGFWLNGKPYHQLIGGNRHQDFAYVGNALPNSQQWRDAKRLKDAGMDIIRAAHYPQDPSFMDACDELGLFIIVPTPGWQFWNKEPQWAEMVHQNTRQIVRRDRNHPCVLMWEPILNETRYPEDFALKALQVTREEYPYEGRPVAAADLNSAGVKDNYDVLYDWADNIGTGKYDTDKCIFTREWGEYVDDWYAHNAINRAARPWGEHAMLEASLSLADTYGMMYRGQRQFIGGCLWHPFDHQRGYHPDAYLGGIYDAFRQKKYAAEMFMSQIPISSTTSTSKEASSGSVRGADAFLFIAHEMTQFSPEDVTIFTNCDSVRLTSLGGWKQQTLPVVHNNEGIPNAPVVFKGFWDFWKAREISYTKRNWQGVTMVAEGIKDGKVVCTETKMPSRRSTKLRLYADEMGKKLVADGSDFIVVVAEVTDDNGNVRRLARESVLFTVEGEGELMGGPEIQANPRLVEWGSAPALVRSTHKAGHIRIIARPLFEGAHAPQADTLEIESVPYVEFRQIGLSRKAADTSVGKATNPQSAPAITDEERRKMLEEVEQQQQDFGIQ